MQWEAIFSCHVCVNKNQIPFVGMKTKDDNLPIPQHFQPYTLREPWILDQEHTLQNLVCVEPTAAALGFKNEDQFLFPENCGAGFLNLRYVTLDSRNSVVNVNTETID